MGKKLKQEKELESLLNTKKKPELISLLLGFMVLLFLVGLLVKGIIWAYSWVL